MFSDSDLLQSCDKADLGDHIIGGSVHWTANQGLWQPAKNQVILLFSRSLFNDTPKGVKKAKGVKRAK